MASILRIKDFYDIPKRKYCSNQLKGASASIALNGLRNMIGVIGPNSNSNSNLNSNSPLKGAFPSTSAFNVLDGLRNIINNAGSANSKYNNNDQNKKSKYKFKLNLNWKDPYHIVSKHNRLVTNSPFKGAAKTQDYVIRYRIEQDKARKMALYNLSRTVFD